MLRDILDGCWNSGWLLSLLPECSLLHLRIGDGGNTCRLLNLAGRLLGGFEGKGLSVTEASGHWRWRWLGTSHRDNCHREIHMIISPYFRIINVVRGISARLKGFIVVEVRSKNVAACRRHCCLGQLSVPEAGLPPSFIWWLSSSTSPWNCYNHFSSFLACTEFQLKNLDSVQVHLFLRIIMKSLKECCINSQTRYCIYFSHQESVSRSKPFWRNNSPYWRKIFSPLLKLPKNVSIVLSIFFIFLFSSNLA